MRVLIIVLVVQCSLLFIVFTVVIVRQLMLVQPLRLCADTPPALGSITHCTLSTRRSTGCFEVKTGSVQSDFVKGRIAAPQTCCFHSWIWIPSNIWFLGPALICLHQTGSRSVHPLLHSLPVCRQHVTLVICANLFFFCNCSDGDVVVTVCTVHQRLRLFSDVRRVIE